MATAAGLVLIAGFSLHSLGDVQRVLDSSDIKGAVSTMTTQNGEQAAQIAAAKSFAMNKAHIVDLGRTCLTGNDLKFYGIPKLDGKVSNGWSAEKTVPFKKTTLPQQRENRKVLISPTTISIKTTFGDHSFLVSDIGDESFHLQIVYYGDSVGQDADICFDWLVIDK